jgi:hypothetical protein
MWPCAACISRCARPPQLQLSIPLNAGRRAAGVLGQALPPPRLALDTCSLMQE